MNCLECSEKYDLSTLGTVHICNIGPYVGCTEEDCTEWLCEDCSQNRSEREHERRLEAFYGGDGPPAQAEQLNEAARIQRELK